MKKVTAKSLKHGVKIFVAHPVYGIEEILVTSRPYMVHLSVGSTLFVKGMHIYNGRKTNTHFSLNDSGITPGLGYNYRKTFFKRKQAEAWQKKMLTDPGFIEQHKRHEELIEELDELEFDYEYN